MRVCPKCSLETEAAICPNDGATTVPVQVAAETYPAGTVINDRYRIDSVIGIGGFGAVYKCTQRNMDQEVAVKVLRSEHLTSVEHVKRFTREAQAASKLKHPNTISIFDFGTHQDGALYLAMEFLQGETFANRMEERETMCPEVLVHIMEQICHSLTEAHEAGLIHRDLKPENIMLLPVAGDPNFVKVLDFGIAAFEKDGAEDGQRLTETGMIMGTPTYMSPEQARGETLDARSDIYALGVMMYEASCGRVPFEGDQPMTVLVKHIKDPPEPPRAVSPEAQIPRAIEKVILRCLEKEPGHRPQSARELAEGLKRALTISDDALRRLSEFAPPTGPPPAGPAPEGPTTLISGLKLTDALQETSGEARPLDPSAPLARGSDTPSNRTSLWVGLAAFALVGLIAVLLALITPSIQREPQPRPAPSVRATPQKKAASLEKTASQKKAASDTPRLGTPAPQPTQRAPGEPAASSPKVNPTSNAPKQNAAAETASKTASRTTPAPTPHPTHSKPTATHPKHNHTPTRTRHHPNPLAHTPKIDSATKKRSPRPAKEPQEEEPSRDDFRLPN